MLFGSSAGKWLKPVGEVSNPPALCPCLHAGSHLVGYLLAVLAMLPHFYTKTNPHPLAVLSPLLVLAVPLMDLACMVVIRTRAGRPFWVGDTNHLSHRLVRCGLTRTQAVLAIWLLAAVIGGLALAL